MNHGFIEIGYLTACIDGDRRYTDTLYVEYNLKSDTVIVTVKTGCPAGGRDSSGGVTEREVFSETVPPGASEALVSSRIRAVIGNSDYNFKRYGKPTKRFQWSLTRAMGYNASNLRDSLKICRENKSE